MANGHHMKAATLFLNVLSTVPELYTVLEEELCQSLSCYTSSLVRQNRVKEALWLYDNATRSLPYASSLWFDQGRLSFEVKQYLRALASFQKAWEINPSLYAALDACENVKSMAVRRLFLQTTKNVADLIVIFCFSAGRSMALSNVE